MKVGMNIRCKFKAILRTIFYFLLLIQPLEVLAGPGTRSLLAKITFGAGNARGVYLCLIRPSAGQVPGCIPVRSHSGTSSTRPPDGHGRTEGIPKSRKERIASMSPPPFSRQLCRLISEVRPSCFQGPQGPQEL